MCGESDRGQARSYKSGLARDQIHRKFNEKKHKEQPRLLFCFTRDHRP